MYKLKDYFKFATVSTFVTLTTLFALGAISIIIFIIILAVAGSSNNKTVSVKDESILVLNLNRPIVDRSSDNPLSEINIATLTPVKKHSLMNILTVLKAAAEDDKIKGVYIKTANISAGLGTLEEIRNALKEFKKSGKFVISYSDNYSQRMYYVASVADKVYLNPAGYMSFNGLAAEMIFYKKALNKLNVDMQIIRHGKFKSAGEPFMQDTISENNRRQTEEFLQSIWQNMLADIGESRNITVKEINNILDSLKIRDIESAISHKLIDGVKYSDEIRKELKEKSLTDTSEKLRPISVSQYANYLKQNQEMKNNKIAVIYGAGSIVTGSSDDLENQIASATMAKAIRDAREDKKVKAIVLRVNSGGGSALASEIIWREAELAAKEKPFIVSMGDIAASGGYYIAAPAQAILANKNTLTGSIGVFMAVPEVQKLMSDKLGLTVNTVKTNKHADLGTIFRPLTEEEKEYFQNGVKNIYTTFISHVADGRKLTQEQVDSIGQGRIWSGTMAQDRKLVDSLGGLHDAITLAAEKADISEYSLVSLPKEKNFYEKLVSDIIGNTKQSRIKEEFGPFYDVYETIQELKETPEVQARVPFYIRIK